VVAGGWLALIRCRVVSIGGTGLFRRRCRYSTSGTRRWSSASTSASEGRCIETTLGGRWGSARAGLLPGGLDTQGPRKLVPATRPAIRSAGRVVRPATKELGRTYRDHSGLALGVGSRWAVAGWSRYAGTSQARPCYSTSGILCWSSSRRCDGGAGGDVSRPLWAVAGDWFALGGCRVVSIRIQGARSAPASGRCPQRVAAARPAERVAGRTTRPAVLPTLQRLQRRDNVVATKL
jgi:hypothetical protein